MTDSAFRFNTADLAKPRPFGISAYMRIKNEQQFVRLVIESHLPFYDEIVCVYNDCQDNTEKILLELQQRHPQKIKVLHYLPKVHPINTAEHAAAGDGDINSMANYYNYTLSKCAYSIACKLDADHLAIPHKLEPALQKIRAEFAEGKDKIFLFSGLNVLRNSGGELGMLKNGDPFSGNGDICYHRIDRRSFFTNRAKVEHFNHAYRRGVPAEYVGLLYVHLHWLKHAHAEAAYKRFGWMPFAEFATPAHIKTLAAKMKFTRRARLALYKNPRYFALMHKLTGNYPRIRTARLAGLEKDLQQIDFQRDVIDPLHKWENKKGTINES